MKKVTASTNPARYKIAQNVRNWRLKRKYTLKDLVDKTGIKCHMLLRYEQGICGIPIKKLKVIAKALSIDVRNLFPRRKALKAIYALTQSIRAEEESDVKAGFANDIIYRAIGLSADEYENKEEKSSKHRSKRQEMKKWRIIQGYTQEELAKELGIGSPQIHYYEQGSTMFGERLWEIGGNYQ
ncbi:helix-turn-helix domain-containing protein [Wolbachia endosymbiont (group A) of Myopa testacea]|uniref:helix-turn-helix domain-containing protein n=1 Tax=Wolbachia endosymbiont (group A) of Myopa testacea TaxID=3066148 RepID=UPI00333F7A86